MYFYIIKYVYSFHHTHISVCHFVGVFVYAGTINRPLRLLTVCQLRGEHQRNGLRNTPPGVGADSSCPYPDINKNVYFHNQICVSTLLNTHIHFTKYVFPHY